MFDTFNGLELFFIFCSAAGGFFVFVRLVLQVIGGDTDGDTAAHGADDGVAVGHDVDSDIGFHILSVHGLSSFFMMFGLVGLATYRQSQAGALKSMLAAVAAGTASVWVIGKLFKAAGRLQSSGTVPTARAVGSRGSIYLTVPKGGTGRANISFQGRMREFDAMAKDGAEIPTGTAVKVAEVNGNILVVERVD